MRIELLARQIIFENPKIELLRTIDKKEDRTFTPVILLIDSVNTAIRYDHELPPQPYVNGTWTDEDVEAAIAAYVKSIALE